MIFPWYIAVVALALTLYHGNASAQASRLSDRDIVDAYHYFLGRLLVLRQEHLDLQGMGRWNVVIHRQNYKLDVPILQAKREGGLGRLLPAAAGRENLIHRPHHREATWRSMASTAGFVFSVVILIAG